MGIRIRTVNIEIVFQMSILITIDDEGEICQSLMDFFLKKSLKKQSY